MADLVVMPIEALGKEQLSHVQMIYEEGFSADLRVPFSELTRPGEADQTFVAMDGEAPAGIAALRLLWSVEWSFLRYFAIAGKRRGQGAGHRFWQLLHQSLRTEAWPACVIFEVENPSETTGDGAERAIRQRRISFWTACGARLLPVAGYVLPDLTASGTAEPMLLMAAGQAGAPSIQGGQLRRLVQAIYTDRYGLTPNDPLVKRALASIVV